MDTSLTIRPQTGAPSADYARPAAIEVPAVPTVLPATQTVSAPGAGSSTSTDPDLSRNANPPAQDQPAQYQAKQAADTTMRMVVLDPATREVIFRVVDSRSRQVLRQVPDEALLRMRAYNKAVQDGQTPADVMSRADMQV
ncbi:MAG: hypothetical protein HXX10_13845 [Rhodoplanes sp.]|uniref:hypothetical protein n=1 Tax=Rhodoplanes sp. TaxID=1968906 RepID=UPI00179A6B1A|nr:hypothetical protein [Rhodoplanes sp.]NVO15113.1 hypothetical protein [Rhodoplanes sp.]